VEGKAKDRSAVVFDGGSDAAYQWGGVSRPPCQYGACPTEAEGTFCYGTELSEHVYGTEAAEEINAEGGMTKSTH
jgi:hypothetical protein